MTGELVDMKEYGVWEPFSVKVQTVKTAIESACMILRIDDIVSGWSKKREAYEPVEKKLLGIRTECVVPAICPS
jgi:chaperonin GroEL (HSP60 family)